MTFGLETTDFETSVVRVRGAQNIKPFFDAFKAHGHEEVDTARIYGNGDTELVRRYWANMLIPAKYQHRY
jgi:aflatoxin B1 aldehyde reductase